MSVEYLPFGHPFPDLSPAHLSLPMAKHTLSACVSHSDFEVVELCRLDEAEGKVFDIIVVDCINGLVPSRNTVGIKARERLALAFAAGDAPQVRSLRKGFPEKLLHLNSVRLGQPPWLCIYLEHWGIVERTWTPQKFLQRILWWLAETAKGTLHREDQPLERIYFNSPMEIVLPPDFGSKIKDPRLSFTCERVERSDGSFRVIRGKFVPKVEGLKCNISQTEVIMLQLSPIMHAITELNPGTLGLLHDDLLKRGTEFIEKLKSAIREMTPTEGRKRDPSGKCLLILTIPVRRTDAADPEKYEVRAFYLLRDLAGLGEAVGILNDLCGVLFNVEIIGATSNNDISTWRDIEIYPNEISYEPDKSFSRDASGVNIATADFRGVICGVGALGGALAELWSREAWGDWTFIDHDTLEPHNIVRHIGKNFQIGIYKVDAVKLITDANNHPSCSNVTAIADSALNRANRKVADAISSAEVIIDVTTTLEVPRDLAQRDDVPRSVSIFLTPSGNGSVLLLESADKSLRLDSLEAQYYRAIINSDWGSTHLNGHSGMLWVGAGCRDLSAKMSNEAVQLHAALIARQVRILRDSLAPRIRIWTYDPDSGAILAEDVSVHEKIQRDCGEWSIRFDAGIHQKLCSMRHAHLPDETGGIILGYIDQKLKSIYVVDILSAPRDSESDRTGFTRGVEGLQAKLDEVAQRTANIVSYIGEWHSHPSFNSAYPSALDRALIETLATTLSLEGQPALMIIIGSAGDMSVSVKEGA